MRIGQRQIGPGEPVYIIAEIGVNHDGEVDKALMLADAAAEAGADAIKLQYFKTDLLMSKAAKLAAYQKDAGEDDPVRMLRRLELSLDEMSRVVDRAHERGIHAIVTVFSTELVEPAMGLAWDAVKSASPDIVHRPLLEALMDTGRPMIVSTGASTLEEVKRAVGWLDEARERLAVLQCVSCYPCPLESASLAAIEVLRSELAVPVGYSDHTSNDNTSSLITPIGACLLEKHLTYSAEARGPDHGASLDPIAFSRYCEYAHSATTSPDNDEIIGEATNASPFEIYFGPSEKRVLDCERDVRTVSRQSLVAARDLTAGGALTQSDLTIKRPGTGIEPFMLGEVVGRTLARDVEGDVPVTWEDLE